MTILTITDGTDSVDLVWHNRANRKFIGARDGWAPSIPVRMRSRMGGKGPYDDVSEELEYHVCGESAVETLANHAKLVRLLDNADAWSDYVTGMAPVIIRWAPEGASQALSCVIVGRANENDAAVMQPNTMSRDLKGFMIAGVRGRFLRRGLWLGRQEQVSSSSAANPNILTATFATSVDVASPVMIELGGFDPSVFASLSAGVLLIARSSSRLSIIEAEALTASGYTSVADSANDARGGSVLRYTPASTSYANSGQLTSGVLAWRRIGVYAAVRNNSGSTTWRIKCQLEDEAGNSDTTSETPIDTSTTNPRIVFLGVATLPASAHRFRFQIAASAASGTLDIDYVAFIALDEEPLGTTRVIEHGDLTLTTAFGSSPVDLNLYVDDGALTQQKARVYMDEAGENGTEPFAPLDYQGDPFVSQLGTTISLIWLSTNSAAWCATNASGTPLSNNIRVTRKAAFLSPQ
jgi:hypothetical protein